MAILVLIILRLHQNGPYQLLSILNCKFKNLEIGWDNRKDIYNYKQLYIHVTATICIRLL